MDGALSVRFEDGRLRWYSQVAFRLSVAGEESGVFEAGSGFRLRWGLVVVVVVGCWCWFGCWLLVLVVGCRLSSRSTATEVATRCL